VVVPEEPKFFRLEVQPPLSAWLSKLFACATRGSEEILKIAFDDAGDVFIDGERLVNDHARVQRARLKAEMDHEQAGVQALR
jgi:hypothetical protein